MPELRKAVIPVAGLGTRMLPATKSIPKEMLPIVDRPVIQYAIDEARAAGIEHFVFVTGRNKQAIEDYLDRVPELDDTLAASGKRALAAEIDGILPAAGTTSFTRQQAPLGLGHAVWCARDIIGDEPFALLLPDMVWLGERGCLAQAADVFREVGGNVIAVGECDPSTAHRYGIVGRGRPVAAGGFEITAMVEKPAPGTAPSSFYINGRYILQPAIFDLLATQESGAGGEIQLTDAMLRLARDQSFHGAPAQGRMFDCGSKEGFLEANIAFALARPELRSSILDVMSACLGDDARRMAAA
jgi:UTP--glucose-1-phosphate uridylyltransferase